MAADAEGLAVQDLESLAQRFRRFAQTECGDAPLYRRLASAVASDAALLALAAHGQVGPKPNLFLAAVHYLLLRGVAHPLAAFYPTVSGHALPTEDPYPAFRRFCLEQQEPIRALMETRRVQTNEVARSAYLVPSLHLVAQYQPGRPLALVEVGASAGLLLLWDRYSYDFGGGRRLGGSDAPVIRCELAGQRQPALPASFPEIAARVGIDLNPINVRDPDAALWLRALVWPEHPERAERLRQAIALVAQAPPTLIAGDAPDLLPDVLSRLPREAMACVFHAHTLNQCSPRARARLLDVLAAQSMQRDVYHLSLESPGLWCSSQAAEPAGLPTREGSELPTPTRCALELRRFSAGRLVEQSMLGRYHPHGGRMVWLLEGSPV